ncbi:hypothetical protein C1752_01137 [Acaryochloris thomasi RCC1774]|uniref:CHAT domain-containing protein n=1 Tax=Acaryochloris thomasi RCC1774 TaxID=1764569 RepID=A0A2W1JL32_9CYAN|nr:CHAT domain-containing protein [Acaryochloris thomasi]PZD74078.1 hypothetical protein C1752_01137 [Acaryochloris thomasi RCC1774]
MAGLWGAVPVCLAVPVLAKTELKLSNLVVQFNDLDQQGKDLFERKKFAEAASVLEQAVDSHKAKGDHVSQAVTLSNLSLVYEQLGQWPQANHAIAMSVNLLKADGLEPDTSLLPTLAQALNIQGRLQLSQGKAQEALATWKQAESAFAQIKNAGGVTRSLINQAQALQSLGLYRRAIASLAEITATLSEAAPSRDQVVALRSFGDALRIGGELEQSKEVLQKSLEMARQLQLLQESQAAQLSLGNTLRALGNSEQAQEQYQSAASGAGLVPIQVQLNQLSLQIDEQQWSAAQDGWPQIEQGLSQQPSSRSTVYAYLNLTDSLMKLRRLSPVTAPNAWHIAELLVRARQQAQRLGDSQTESYVVGALGSLYEQEQQWATAEKLTRRALVLSKNIPEGAFRWQWQLGRLLKVKGDRQGAIASYSGAVETLQSLRRDLVAINPEVQFTFRDSVEPIHRQLVSLLLDAETEQPSTKNLEVARLTIESLQLAELDNFFREACLDANPVLIDEIDPQAAVVYPIILPDRLAVIVSLPGEGLKLFSTDVPQALVERTVDRFRLALGQPNSPRVIPLAQQIYDWLLRPVAKDLAVSDVETLVFVQDGVLRNIPMAALHDGLEYLVEKYATALTPGLQLIEPKSLLSSRPKVLIAGLSEPQDGFSALVHVPSEIESVERQSKGRSLLNETFTQLRLQSTLDKEFFPVVHLATHGQFSSRLDETFLLTWEGRINANQLRGILQTNELQRGGVELLVLSACETAVGDEMAALGLAGIAMRSGTRSTIATLWQVNDQATTVLMRGFYQNLAQDFTTTAEALRQAKISILKQGEDNGNPYYWSPFILLGSWQ